MSLAQSGRANFCRDSCSRSVHFTAAGGSTLLNIPIDEDKLLLVEKSLEKGDTQVLSFVLSTLIVFEVSAVISDLLNLGITFKVHMGAQAIESVVALSQVRTKRLVAREENSIKEGSGIIVILDDCHAINVLRGTSTRCQHHKRGLSDRLLQ